VKTPSFPSGHATSSMIFYLTLALALAPKGPWRRICVAGAILFLASDESASITGTILPVDGGVMAGRN